MTAIFGSVQYAGSRLSETGVWSRMMKMRLHVATGIKRARGRVQAAISGRVRVSESSVISGVTVEEK